MALPMVEVSDLWHRYSQNWALRGISFSLDEYGVVGLLGSNGAGKSTLMNILCGCLNQSQGSALVAGLDLKTKPLEARRRIGFLPQQAPLSTELNIEEYLRFCGSIRQIPSGELSSAVDFVIERCGLSPMRERLIGNLSGGYRQRVGIAQALIHRPSLVVLDEPTVGLDPNQLSGVRELIREIGEDHMVLFSTHILSEVDALCRDVLMIEQGDVIFHGEIESFRTLAAPHSVILVCSSAPSTKNIRSSHRSISDVEAISPSRFRIQTDGDRSVTEALISRAYADGWGIQEISFERSSLEDVFKNLTKGVAT